VYCPATDSSDNPPKTRTIRHVHGRAGKGRAAWGRELQSFRKGEIYRVSIAIAGVLLAQRCAEPLFEPPGMSRAMAA